MATLYGNQYNNAYVVNPSVKLGIGDYKGTVRRMYFDYTITAVPTNGDVIKLGKLPAGARVYDACLSFPDLGTAGTLELGWAASTDAVEAASASGLLSTVDVNSAAASRTIIGLNGATGAAVAGLMKKFSSEVDIQIAVTAAWTVTSGTIKGFVEYVLE